MSGHPIREHMQLSKSLGSAKTSDILASSVSEPDSPYKDGDKVRLLCILATVRKKITKNDTTMAFLSIEDVYGAIEVLVFPKKFDKYGQYFIEDEIVLLTGKVSLRDDEVPKLLCEDVVPLSEIPDDEAYLKNYKLPELDYSTPKSAYSAYELPKREEKEQVPEMQQEANAAQEAKREVDVPVSKSTPAKKTNRGIFLRLPSVSSEQCIKAKKMCAIFDGNIPVIMYYADTNSYDFATGICVEDNEKLLYGLKKLLGETNVVRKL